MSCIALAPNFDLVNHEVVPNADWMLTQSKGNNAGQYDVKIVAIKDIPIGDEVVSSLK